MAEAKRKPAVKGAAETADSFERLIGELEKLPGVGRRSAERMAYYLLEKSVDEAMALALAIRDVKKNLHPCSVCGNLTEHDRCPICADPRRQTSLLCVVEWPRDLRAIEKTGLFKGFYHVLMGRLSPLNGVEPHDLRIETLIARVNTGEVKELLLATSPSLEGDATAYYLKKKIQALTSKVRITRLARGIPEGGELSFAQVSTVGEALKGRTELT
jgi:recombination protein RecR